MIKITGIVIAGGKSLRMGFDKINIHFRGKTFLENSIHLLENFTDDIIISSNQKINSKYTVINDEIKNIGPIGGIYTALKNMKTDLALIIPADVPLLSKEALEKLIDSYNKSDEIVVFKNLGKPEMLIGIYHKNMVSIIEKQIDKKEYKLQNLLQKSVSKKIDGTMFAHQFVNINTQADLEKIK